MTRKLARILARLHAEFGLYDSEMFTVPDSRNIICQIALIEELAYLHDFYVNYQQKYITVIQKQPDRFSTPKLTNVSRSVDLPFIGEKVIQTGRAKYLFVFEGSLSHGDKLSITVLACLWPLISLQPLNNLFQTFWPSPYFYIVECLGITPDIAKDSYAVDAVRIGTQDGKQDRQQNRELLRREIEQLEPEIVVLVGKTAADTIRSKALRTRESLYFKVPFPTRRRSKPDIEKANQKYEELRDRWAN